MSRRRGRLDNVRRTRMLAPTAGGIAAGTLAVTMSPDVVGVSAPTTVLLVLAAAQLGLALALRDALARWAAHRPVGAMLDWISARTVTIYLWHVPALAVLTGFAVVDFDAPQPFGAGWHSDAPLRLAVLVVGLAAFVRAFGHCERAAQWHFVRHGHRGRASPSPDSPVGRMGSAAPGRKT